jgi:hypothetical protein
MNILNRAAATAAIGLAMTVATDAAATTYTITIPGTITSVVNPGPISVGDHFTLTTTFDDSYVVAWGATGYNVAFSYKKFTNPGGPLPVSGPLNWSLVLSSYTYMASDDEHSGQAAYVEFLPGGFTPSLGLGGPAIVFNSAGVFGVDNLALQDGLGQRPLLIGNGGVIGGGLYPGAANSPGNFNTLPLNNTFVVRRSDWQNPNTTPDQNATGVFDFSKATILISGAPVPEPSAWAMLIVGFGLVGFGLRRHRGRRAVAA